MSQQHQSFFVQQLLEQRGTKLPDLDYLSYGEPTTYGTTFVYSTEVARSLQHPRVKKGSMNKGSSGLTAAPWAENVVQPEKMASVYGKDFDRKPPVEEVYDTAALLAKNKEMKQKQRAEALVRQEHLFAENKDAYDNFMKEERRRYREAQASYEKRTSRVFTHTGVSIRSKLSDVELFARDLNRRSQNEAKIRALAPRHSALTPQPTLDMLKTVDDSKLIVPLRAKSVAGGEGFFEGNLDGFSDPSPMTTTSIASAHCHARLARKQVAEAQKLKELEKEAAAALSNDNNVNNAQMEDDNKSTMPAQNPTLNNDRNNSVHTNASSANASSHIAYGPQHVYTADKQRIKYLRLEAERMRKGKEGLIAHGWDEATNPAGPDKIGYHPEDDVAGMDADALRRVNIAFEKKKADDFARREQLAAAQAKDPMSAIEQQIKEMNALSRQPGVHPRTQKRYAEIMDHLLHDTSAVITVPKNLGIPTPMSEEAIRERAAAQQNETSGAANTTGDKAMGGGDSNENSRKEATAAAAKNKASNNASSVIFNIVSTSKQQGVEGGNTNGDDTANNAEQQQAQEDNNNNQQLNFRPARRTIHKHFTVPISQHTPLDPTRKDIDRELKSVVYGGHLIRDRSAAIKSLGPERIQHIKSLNLAGVGGYSGGGGAKNPKVSVGGGAGAIASVSGGGGGARMAKPMVPPAHVARSSLALL